MATSVLLRLHAAWLLTIAPFAIRSRYRQRFLNPVLRSPSANPQDELVAAMHDVLRWHPFRCSCLERASALHRLLHLHGVPSHLRIGVKQIPVHPGIAAHAWVEAPGGQPLLDEENKQFLVLQGPADTIK